eukprot:753295-Hanusia_phi.AAC.6
MWENDAELLLNASRVVSKLSLTKSCQEEMASISGFHESFIQVIARHQDRAPLLIRLTFVLGNLTSSDEEHRMKIFGCRNSLDIVLDILYTHGQLLISAAEELETKIEQSVSPTNEASPADVNELSKHASQDLLVKVVRLLAHLAISPDVGPVLATKEKIEMLIMLANTINIVYCEELILNVVSAITNLSYYSGEDSIIWQTRMELVKILSEMLFVENQEAVLEATRAFGNLSRDQDARRLMHSSRIDEALVLLLDHSDRDVLAASADAERCACAAHGGTGEERNVGLRVVLHDLLCAVQLGDNDGVEVGRAGGDEPAGRVGGAVGAGKEFARGACDADERDGATAEQHQEQVQRRNQEGAERGDSKGPHLLIGDLVLSCKGMKTLTRRETKEDVCW